MSCNQISPTPNLARPAAANNAEKRAFFLGHVFVDFRSTKANIKEKGYFIRHQDFRLFLTVHILVFLVFSKTQGFLG